MPKELKVVIVGDASQLNKTFGQASTSAKTFGDRMNNVGASMRSVGKHMAIAGGIITGVAVVVGKKLVDSALAAEAAQAKLDQAFKNSGLSAAKYTKQVEDTEAAGRKLGFTNVETIDSFTKLIQSGESVTQATKDIGLAQDYARATGRDLETATGALVKVHQGLLRPLKELGISLPQNTDHMKALTAAHKESKTAITANEKALAFQQDKLATGAQAIELMTKKLHGQAQAFSETSAGGIAVFNAQMDAFQESLGAFLLPFITKVTDALNRLLAVLSNLSPHTQKLVVDIGLAVAAFGAVLLVVGPIVAAIGSLIPVIVALASPIGIVVVGLAALTAALIAAVLWPDKLQMALQRMGLSAKTSKEIVDDLRDAFTAIKAVVQAVWPAIQAIVVPALKVIQGILMIVSGILRGDFSEAWKGVKLVVANELKFMLAIITAFPRVVLGAAEKLGAAILTGIGNGLRALPAKVKAGLAAIGPALLAVVPIAAAYAGSIGVAIVQGVLSGIGNIGQAVLDKVKAGIGWALSKVPHVHFGSDLAAFAGEQIGIPITVGAVGGLNDLGGKLGDKLKEQIQKALEAAKTAVTDAKSAFSQAFDELASTALEAFDRVSEQFQTKHEKLIARQDERRAAAQRQQAKADADAAVAAASQPVVAKEGESLEDFTARVNAQNDALKQALQQQADAAFEIQRAKDEKTAAQERKQYEDHRALQRRHFDEDLQALEAQLEKGHISAKAFRQKVLALFEKFDVPFKNAGKVLGLALQEGLADSLGNATDLLKPLINAIKKLKIVVSVDVVDADKKGSPEKRALGGPVRRGSRYIVGERGPEMFIPNVSGRILSNAVSSAAMGGGTVLNVYVAGSVVTENELTDTIRQNLIRMGKRNGGNILGGMA